MLRQFHDIAAKRNVVLDQGEKTPLFLVGVFYLINSFDPLGAGVFEIDSGSDRVVVSKSVCDRLGLEVDVFEAPRTILGLNSEPIVCDCYTLFRFELQSQFGHAVSLNLMAYVIDTKAPCLLGSDVLNFNECVIDYKHSALLVKDKSVELLKSGVEAVERCSELNLNKFIVNEVGDPLGPFFCCKNYIVKPGQLVKVLVEADQHLFYDDRIKPPFILFFIGHELEGFKIIDIKVREIEEKYFCLVRNVSDTILHINAGQELGFVCLSDTRPMTLRGGVVPNDSKIDKMFKVHANDDSPVMINELRQRRKLSAQEFDDVMDRGVAVHPGLGEEMTDTEYTIPKANIDENVEFEKHKNVARWDREELLGYLSISDTYNEMKGEIPLEEANEIRKKLEDLLWGLRGIFSKGDWSDLDEPMSIPPITIQMVDNCPDVIEKYRTMSPKKREVLKGIMEKLIKAGIVVRSSGLARFASCPHLVLEEKLVGDKPVVKYRFTIDYRRVNEYIKGETYKIKLIQPILEEVANTGAVFSTCDAASYFWQFPLDSKSQEVSAFYYNELLYKWARGPQGVKVIPNWAARISDGILEGGGARLYPCFYRRFYIVGPHLPPGL